MREAGLAGTYFDQAQVIQTTQTESQEDIGMLPGTESRADLLFKSADGKVILVDVTSTSGISKHAKLHQYTPGVVAGMAEQRKAASSRSCGISSQAHLLWDRAVW
jgi:hypothetical protein